MKYIIYRNLTLLMQSVTFFLVLKNVPIELYNEFVLFTVTVGYALFANLGISNGIIYYGQSSATLKKDNVSGLIVVVLMQLLISIYFQDYLLTLACVFGNASNYLKSTSRLFKKSYYLQIYIDFLYTLTILFGVVIFKNYDILIELYTFINVLYFIVHSYLYLDLKDFKENKVFSKSSLKLFKYGISSLFISCFFILWPVQMRDSVASFNFVINQELFYIADKLIVFLMVTIYFFTPKLIEKKSKVLYSMSFIINPFIYFGMVLGIYLANYLFNITKFTFIEVHAVAYYFMIYFILLITHTSLIKSNGKKLSIYLILFFVIFHLISWYFGYSFNSILSLILACCILVFLTAYNLKGLLSFGFLILIFPGPFIEIRLFLFLVTIFLIRPKEQIIEFYKTYKLK